MPRCRKKVKCDALMVPMMDRMLFNMVYYTLKEKNLISSMRYITTMVSFQIVYTIIIGINEISILIAVFKGSFFPVKKEHLFFVRLNFWSF